MRKDFILHRETADYIAEHDMTPLELQDLNTWVHDGHSVYGNPWYIADENGNTINYIAARRLVHELSREQNGTDEMQRDSSIV